MMIFVQFVFFYGDINNTQKGVCDMDCLCVVALHIEISSFEKEKRKRN